MMKIMKLIKYFYDIFISLCWEYLLMPSNSKHLILSLQLLHKKYLIMKNWPSVMVVYPWLSTPFFDLVNCVIFPLHVNICLSFFLFFFWFWKIYNYLGYLMSCVFFSDFSYCSLKDFNKKDFWQPTKQESGLIDFSVYEVYVLSGENRASNTAGTFFVLCIHLS